MSESIVYLIYWDSYSSNTYLYGSSVKYLPDRRVRFCNQMMPSGYAINQWTSFCNFQADRREPQLPVLEEKNQYVYQAYFHEYPEGTVLLRFDFYNLQNEKIDSFITDKKRGEFLVPEGTFRYTMQLVQSGSIELLFSHVEIFCKTDVIFSTIQNKRQNSKKLHVLIPEVKKRMAYVSDLTNFQGFPNIIALSPGDCMMALAGELRLLKELADEYDQVYFFGKGKQSEEIARDLSKLIQKGHARKWLFCDE